MPGVAGGMQHGAGKRGLAGAEVAVQVNGETGRKRMRERGAERRRAFFVMEPGLEMPHLVKWLL